LSDTIGQVKKEFFLFLILTCFKKKDDGLTLHRRPVSQSTDSIRGATGYKRGVHLWQVTWLATQRGTHACVGVASKSAPLRAAGYQALVGGNDESWGWDLGR